MDFVSCPVSVLSIAEPTFIEYKDGHRCVESRVRGRTIFRAEMAAKYGAPVYSLHPPMTAILPGVRTAAMISL